VNIDDIVSRLQERKVVVQPPSKIALRARRKRRKRRSDLSRYPRGSEKWLALREKLDGFWTSPHGVWANLRKVHRDRARKAIAAGRKPIEWRITLEEWLALWTQAGEIPVQGGLMVAAFRLRGPKKGQAKLYRIDREKDWTLDNVIVVMDGDILVKGRDVKL
jgi:hypothetical protein